MARYVILEDVVKWVENVVVDQSLDCRAMNAFWDVLDKLESGEWQKELNEHEAKVETLSPR